MPNLQRELPSQIFNTFVSIRNDRRIMEYKNSSNDCDRSIVDFLIDQVKALEREVIAGLRKEREEREREKMEYKRITASVEHDIEMWAEQKRTEVLEKDCRDCAQECRDYIVEGKTGKAKAYHFTAKTA